MDPKISKPCPASWDAMTGDQQSRHCDKCNKSVHNISELSAAEAEALLCKSTTSVCIRMQQTKDGAFKTKSGWMKRVALAGAAGLTLIPMVGCEPQTANQPLTGASVYPSNPTPESGFSMGEAVANPEPLTGDIAPPEPESVTTAGKIVPVPEQSMGKIACPPEQKPIQKPTVEPPIEDRLSFDNSINMLGQLAATPDSPEEPDTGIIEITTRQEISDKPE